MPDEDKISTKWVIIGFTLVSYVLTAVVFHAMWRQNEAERPVSLLILALISFSWLLEHSYRRDIKKPMKYAGVTTYILYAIVFLAYLLWHILAASNLGFPNPDHGLLLLCLVFLSILNGICQVGMILARIKMPAPIVVEKISYVKVISEPVD